MSLRFYWTLGDYNFENESFDVKFDAGNSKILSLGANFLYNEIENRPELNKAELEKNFSSVSYSVPLAVKGRFGMYSPLKFSMSMEKSKAQEFLNSRKKNNGKIDKSVLCIVYYKVPVIYEQNPYENLSTSLLGRKFDVSGNFYKLEIYDNEENMNKLYSGSIK